MDKYDHSLFFKELPYPPIDEQLLLDCNIPILSNEDKIKHQNKVNPYRRFIVNTHEGIMKCSWYLNKKINDQQFNNHIKEILKDEGCNLAFGHQKIPNYASGPGWAQCPKHSLLDIRKQWVWGSNSLTAHNDKGRKFFYMYILDPGGDNVETRWFLEPGKYIEREWERSLTMIHDTQHLEKVYSIILKPKTLYYFNSSIIHDVINMTSERTAITVE